MQTIGELRKLIRAAKRVHVRPFLGCTEAWVKIAKADVLGIFAAYPADKPLIDLEIEDQHLFSENGELFLG